MGGCTLIVTLSMCITFSIRRKTWLTLCCSIKQLRIRVQSLLICNVSIVSLFIFLNFFPLSLRLSFLTNYTLKEQGIQLLMISTYCLSCHSFMQLQVRHPNISQSYWLEILLVPVITVKKEIPNQIVSLRKNNKKIQLWNRHCTSQPLHFIPFTLGALTSVH